MQISQAYEVEKLPGEVTVEVCQIERTPIVGKEGKFRTKIVRKQMKQPAGYMVYCARGHSFRVSSLEKLRDLGLDTQPGLVDMESGLVVAPRLSLRPTK